MSLKGLFAIAATFFLVAAGPRTLRDSPRATADAFCRTYLGLDGSALLTGENRRVMAPLLSRSFLAHLDAAVACQQDWIRQQPKNSTDKPPFVDCCLFSASADWFPTSYTIGRPKPLTDGRVEVPIEYRYRTGAEDHRWPVAVIVTKERGRFVVDDFIGDVDREPSRLAKDWNGCKGGRWIGQRQVDH